jgi:hypothetical protein
MAMNKVINVDQYSPSGPQKTSSLENFANVLNIGVSLAGLASQAGGLASKATDSTRQITSPQAGTNGNYTLGVDYHSMDPAWMRTYYNPRFSGGQLANASQNMTQISPDYLPK